MIVLNALFYSDKKHLLETINSFCAGLFGKNLEFTHNVCCVYLRYWGYILGCVRASVCLVTQGYILKRGQVNSVVQNNATHIHTHY